MNIMKKRNIFFGLVLMLGLTGCYDLDKMPEGVLSTTIPFASTGEMRNYLDQFYQTGNYKYDYVSFGDGMRAQGFDAGGGQYIAGADTHSDNMASSSVSTRLAGETTLSSAVKLQNYTAIRNLNFMLCNLDNCVEKGSADYNQYVGEAYYFRAWYYYQMFISYGRLTWVNTPLDPNMEEMKLPRANRTIIADSILADLDKAVMYLNTQNNSATMRIHKDVARALKSEVALFEGTWEKYHKAKNDKFFDSTVTDEKIRDYFNQAVAAAKEVMDRGVWAIYNTGNKLDDYRQMFQTTDLSGNPEVLWYKQYDGDQIGNNVNRYLNQGGGSVGVTASLVDDYLTIDGKPFVGDERIEAKKVFGNELQPTLRDPRLSQTVCMPGQQLRSDDKAPYYVVPPLIGTSSYNQNMTGYSLLKHVQIDYTGSLDAEFKGATPAIQFRYADILLNYAEAAFELGLKDQALQKGAGRRRGKAGKRHDRLPHPAGAVGAGRAEPAAGPADPWPGGKDPGRHPAGGEPAQRHLYGERGQRHPCGRCHHRPLCRAGPCRRGRTGHRFYLMTPFNRVALMERLLARLKEEVIKD